MIEKVLTHFGEAYFLTSLNLLQDEHLAFWDGHLARPSVLPEGTG